MEGTVKNQQEYCRRVKLQFINEKLTNSTQKWPNDINRVLEYMNTNLFESEFSISIMREKCRISQKNFSGRFKYFIGLTPASYIKVKRIECTISIFEISPGMVSVSTVAMEVGYRRLTTFSSAFKDITGLPPKKFAQIRRKNRSNSKRISQ